jgi:hypothetical protein
LIKVEPLRTMLTPASSTTAAMSSTYSSALALFGVASEASLTICAERDDRYRIARRRAEEE